MSIALSFAQVPDSSHNSILVKTARIAIQSQLAFDSLQAKEDQSVQVHYFDGLGRPLQETDWKSSPLGQDVVHFHRYDALGREAVQYLPFVVEANGGITADPLSAQSSFYDPAQFVKHATSSHPFAVSQFEASPLNRVLEQGAAGAAWQAHPQAASFGVQEAHEHTQLSEYLINDLAIPFLPPDAAVGAGLSFSYPPGELHVQRIQDENGHWTETYVDKLGRTLISRVQDGTHPDGSPASYATTAYVYDLFDRVKYVIQPEGWDQLETGSVSSLTQEFLDSYAFQYVYDGRGRATAKRVPGGGWVYMVYNKRDQVVFTQDGAQRDRGEWSFTKYDILGRPMMTGLYHSSMNGSSASASALQAQVEAHPLFEEKAHNSLPPDYTGEVVKGYTNQAFPLVDSLTEIHSLTFYDTYDFDQNGTIGNGEEGTVPAIATSRVRGMVTGIQVRVLDPDPDMSKWIWTRTYYDERGREVKTSSTNHLHSDGNGNPLFSDEVSYEYNFVGETKKITTRHYTLDSSSQWTIHTFDLDHRGRVIRENLQLQVESDGEVSGVIQDVGNKHLAYYDYNELGQLVGERLGPKDNKGSHPLQYVDYSYNIRGWLTGINADENGCAMKPDFLTPYTPSALKVHIYSGTETALRPQFFLTGDDGMLGGRNASYELALGIDTTLTDSAEKGVQSNEFWTIHQSLFGGGAAGTAPIHAIPHALSPTENRLLYLRVRVFDEAGNASPWSNVVKLQTGQAGTSTKVTGPSLQEQSYPYAELSCGTTPQNLGTILELRLNAWQVDVELVNKTDGTYLRYTLHDQKEVISYKPELGGVSSTAHNLSNYSRDILLGDTSLTHATGFPTSSPIHFHSSHDSLPITLTYSDYFDEDQSASFALLYAGIKHTIISQLMAHGISQGDAANCATHLKTRYRNVIRSLMGSSANSDLFSMRLLYQEGFAEIDPKATPQYNGNISGMAWRGPSGMDFQGYAYTYDEMNRLKAATYEGYDALTNDWKLNLNAYSTSYSYDKNGNILSLNRQGFTGIDYPSGLAQYQGIDQLTYSYQGNRLIGISDGITGIHEVHDFFQDGSSLATAYLYDGSGNLTQDLNRSISVTYNHLNKPTTVQKDSSGNIQYIYTADGTKLRQKVVVNGAVTKITDYVNNREYVDIDPERRFGTSSKTLTHILHSKGRMVPVGTSDSTANWVQEFFLKDHLGNTRVVFGDYDHDQRINPDPMAQDLRQVVEGYYPFGLTFHSDNSLATHPENQYLYNGKEVQDELDLNWLDYGARMYDPSIARWNGVDALAEEYGPISPYVYVANNPTILIDPDGNEIFIWVAKTRYTWKNGKLWDDNNEEYTP